MQVLRKIGMNRGKSRVWLEGNILSNNGFNNGDKYSVQSSIDAILGNVLTIVWHSDGDRKIAGTVQRPIIDINSAKMLSGFQPLDVVTVNASKGLIVIYKA